MQRLKIVLAGLVERKVSPHVVCLISLLVNEHAIAIQELAEAEKREREKDARIARIEAELRLANEKFEQAADDRAKLELGIRPDRF